MVLSLSSIIAVAVGGAIGSVARYVVGIQATVLLPAARYPLGTTLVNIIGCLLIGFLVEFGTTRWVAYPEWRPFLITGFLGGFTTFSAFGLETATLLRGGDFTVAAASVALQVCLGVLAVGCGGAVAKLFA